MIEIHQQISKKEMRVREGRRDDAKLGLSVSQFAM